MSAALVAPRVAAAIAGALHVALPPLEDPEAPLEDPEAPLEDPEAPLEDPEAPLEDPEAPLEDVAPLDDVVSPELEAPLEDSAGGVSAVPEVGVVLSELHATSEHTRAVAANAAV